MAAKIFIPKETAQGERRAAMAPALVEKFTKAGFQLSLERGIGGDILPDSAYGDVEWVDANAGYAAADIVVVVNPPATGAPSNLNAGALYVGLLAPHANTELLDKLAGAGVTGFALELVPRISRAQSMDALSSQAAIAGYYSAIIGAQSLPRFFPMLTTAAGTIRPAKVLVVGAGVAGLQAIATAKRLGARVSAYDVREAAREQVESLGASFVDTGVSAEGEGGYARELTEDEKRQQQDALAKEIAVSDVVITTAAIPGKRAPLIVSAAMVADMKHGAVVVDLAAATGGNCELTKAGETVKDGSVSIIGLDNAPSAIAEHASEMYARNLLNFLKPLLNEEGDLHIDWEDEVYARSAVTRDGAVVFGKVAS